MPATLERPSENAQLDELQVQIGRLQSQLRALRGLEPPRLVLPELHAANGRIDAAQLADFIAVPLKRLSEGLGLHYKAVHRNPSSEAFQPALQPVKRCVEVLHDSFGSRQSVRIWLNTPHPLLEGQTPLATILTGKAFAVDRLLGSASEGVVS